MVGGHGQRQIIVVSMGCIPVTIGDGVYQPFEPALDWRRFSVQVIIAWCGANDVGPGVRNVLALACAAGCGALGF